MNAATLRRLEALAAQARARTARPAGQAGQWWRISGAAEQRATVFIYDLIGDLDLSADVFVRELRAVTAPAIDLHINSPGGLAWDGIAIYSALRHHPAAIDVSIDGIAASAASFVAQAGDTIAIEKPARMMIHDAGGLALGNADDMRAMADILDDLSDAIAGIYADRAGGPVAAWREAMRATTWYSAAQAVEEGLADRVASEEQAAAPNNRRSVIARARARGKVSVR